ncbi:hypothetical protein [Stenotrophomonas maltophilia]|nr:hypothetical protein [Stenotrophomonas maltophilia]
MSNDNKTLAEVRPGGRVRLGDQAERARFEAWPHAREFEIQKDGSGEYLSEVTHGAWLTWKHLSAQPSPGGQDARTQFEEYRGGDFERDAQGYYVNARTAQDWAMWQAALAARQPSKQPYSVALGEATEFCTQKAARQPVGEPVCSGGFVISNGSGEKYMAWGQVGPEWTADRSAALWLVRRADAEALAAENEDAWSILPVERCALPPNGWACTLADGHEGPCPTIAAPPAQAVDLGGNEGYGTRYVPPEQAFDPGQFRESVERLKDDALHERDPGPAVNAYNRVLALIDSQAVGK